MRILIAEDDPQYAKLLLLCLQNVSADIRVVDTLDGVYESIEKWGPHVITLDLSLRDSSGPTTIDHLNDLKKYAPIVVLSGASDYSFLETSGACDAFLDKGAGNLFCKNYIESIQAGLRKFSERTKTQLKILHLIDDPDSEAIRTLRLSHDSGKLAPKVLEQAKNDPLGAEVLVTVRQLSVDVLELKKDKERRDKVLERIEIAVIGDGEVGTPGLVKRMAKVESEQGWIKGIYLIGTGIVMTLLGLYHFLTDWAHK